MPKTAHLAALTVPVAAVLVWPAQAPIFISVPVAMTALATVGLGALGMIREGLTSIAGETTQRLLLRLRWAVWMRQSAECSVLATMLVQRAELRFDPLLASERAGLVGLMFSLRKLHVRHAGALGTPLTSQELARQLWAVSPEGATDREGWMRLAAEAYAQACKADMRKGLIARLVRGRNIALGAVLWHRRREHLRAEFKRAGGGQTRAIPLARLTPAVLAAERDVRRAVLHAAVSAALRENDIDLRSNNIGALPLRIQGRLLALHALLETAPPRGRFRARLLAPRRLDHLESLRTLATEAEQFDPDAHHALPHGGPDAAEGLFDTMETHRRERAAQSDARALPGSLAPVAAPETARNAAARPERLASRTAAQGERRSGVTAALGGGAEGAVTPPARLADGPGRVDRPVRPLRPARSDGVSDAVARIPPPALADGSGGAIPLAATASVGLAAAPALVPLPAQEAASRAAAPAPVMVAAQEAAQALRTSCPAPEGQPHRAPLPFDTVPGAAPLVRRPGHDAPEPALFLRRVWQPGQILSDTDSHLGGVPPLPERMGWPRHPSRTVPLHFLARLDCAALTAAARGRDVVPDLPGEGALLVFCDAAAGPAPDGAGPHVTLLHLSGPEMSAARPAPLPADLPELHDAFGTPTILSDRDGMRVFPRFGLAACPIMTEPGEGEAQARTQEDIARHLPPRRATPPRRLFRRVPEAQRAVGGGHWSFDTDALGTEFPATAALSRRVFAAIALHAARARSRMVAHARVLERSGLPADAEAVTRMAWLEALAASADLLRARLPQPGGVGDGPLPASERARMRAWLEAVAYRNPESGPVAETALRETLLRLATDAVGAPDAEQHLDGTSLRFIAPSLVPTVDHSDHRLGGAELPGAAMPPEMDKLLQLDSDPAVGFRFTDPSGATGRLEIWLSRDGSFSERIAQPMARVVPV